MQPYIEILKKALPSVAPELAKTLSTINPQRIEVLGNIFLLTHEAAHIARLDDLEAYKNKESSPESRFSKKRQKETQADLIALLMLQNEDFFLSTVSLLSKFFIITFVNQIAYVLHSDPENYDLLEDVMNLHKKHEGVQLVSQEARKCMLEKQKKTYEQEIATRTHPHIFLRIQNTLTAWAAYLVHAHEKPMTKTQAIEHVTKACCNLFATFGVSNKTLEQLLYGIVNDWKKSHE